MTHGQKRDAAALVAACAVLAAATGRPAAAQERCQILDDKTDMLYRASLGCIPRSQVAGHGKTAMVEVDGDYAFAYFREVLGGDWDLNLRVRSTSLIGSGRVQLPDRLVQLAVDAGWTIRYVGGTALQARLAPGIYSDLEDLNAEIFSAPVTLSVIQILAPEVSGIAGLSFRHDFETKFMPVFGIAWAAADDLRVELMLPRSRVVWFALPELEASLNAEWINVTYALNETRDFDRKSLTTQDVRATAGIQYAVSGDLRLMGEIGTVFYRSIEFSQNVPGIDAEADIDQALFIRAGISAPF